MWNVFMRQMKYTLFNYVCIFAGNTHTVHNGTPNRATFKCSQLDRGNRCRTLEIVE